MEWIKKHFKLCVTGFIGLLLVIALANASAISNRMGLAAYAGNGVWQYLSDVSAGDNLTSGVLMVAPCIWTTIDCDRIQGTAGGGMNVNLTNASVITSPTGSITPTDSFANPTTTQLTQAFLMEWNGLTWDRVKGTSATGLDVNIVNASAIGGSSSNITALNSVTTTQVGVATTLTNPNCMHTWTVKTTGTPTNIIVSMEGSLDDVSYFIMDTANLTTATFDARHVVDKCIKYERANLTTLTGGTTPTVTVKILSIN